MKLTDKTKEEFEKWLQEPKKEHGRFGQLVTNTFDSMPFSMQYGVLVDFFDSVGIYIHIELDEFGAVLGEPIHECKLSINFNEIDDELTRHQARQKAIEKANEIFNDRK